MVAALALAAELDSPQGIAIWRRPNSAARKLEATLRSGFSLTIFDHEILCARAFVCAFSMSAAELPPDQILLKEYRPKSIYNIPKTEITKGEVSGHRCPYPRVRSDDRRSGEMGKTMDEVELEKSIILSATLARNSTPSWRGSGKYPKRFEVWCGLDMTGFDQPGFVPKAAGGAGALQKGPGPAASVN